MSATVEKGVMWVTQLLLKLLTWFCNFAFVILTLAGIGIAFGGFFSDFGADLASEVDRPTLIMLILTAMGLALALIALLRKFLIHLRAIVDTVDDGDPFVMDNAKRLRAMAWLSIIAYPLGLLLDFVGWSIDKLDDPKVEFDFEAVIDLTGLLTILLLFILARVFEQGVAMREELEGTV
jgi:Protein of unknown function (DUF2975)